MKRLLPVLGLLALLGFVGFALGGIHTSTSPACATTTSDSHTVAVDSTPVSTIPGTVLSVCVTATATATDSTTTVPGPTTTVTTTATAPPPSSIIADLGRGAISTADPSNMTNGDRFSLVATGWGYGLAALPGKAIEYASGAKVWDGSNIEASPATARANGWLIHDASGREVLYEGYQLTNPGNVSFQNDLKQRIVNFLSLHPGFDGVYFDNFECDVLNFNPTPGTNYPYYTQSGQLLWSDRFDFRNSQISFIANVGAYLKNLGYFVGINGGCYDRNTNDTNTGLATEQWVGRYYPYVTAMMREFWQKRSFDYNPDPYWSGNQDVARYVQSLGLGFIPFEWIAATDLRQTRFYRGCYLLDWNGVSPVATNSGSGAILFDNSSAGVDVWNSEMAKNLGQPTGPKVKVWSGDQWGSGVWRREFTNGYVIVNPTGSSVSVGGETIPAIDAILHQN